MSYLLRLKKVRILRYIRGTQATICRKFQFFLRAYIGIKISLRFPTFDKHINIIFLELQRILWVSEDDAKLVDWRGRWSRHEGVVFYQCSLYSPHYSIQLSFPYGWQLRTIPASIYHPCLVKQLIFMTMCPIYFYCLRNLR